VLSTLDTVALMPSWLSEITSFTQATSRELAQERGPERLSFRGTDLHGKSWSFLILVMPLPEGG
jgi:hypothetical protein